MLSESFSQVTNYFNKPNSIRSTGPIENNVDRENFPKKKVSFNPKRLLKEVIIMI